MTATHLTDLGNDGPIHGGSPAEWSEGELLGRMLLREGAGWREFHRRYDRLIFRCIHKVTGRFRNVVGSEDVREIYCQFLVSLTARDMHKLRRFEPERGNKLGSWIGLLATNTAWDYLRSVARQPACTELSEAESIGSATPNPYERAVDRERLGMVSRALEAFSQKDQDFVRLYYVDGLSPEEIAQEMRISVKTVYSKKHKIRSRLEQALETQQVAA